MGDNTVPACTGDNLCDYLNKRENISLHASKFTVLIYLHWVSSKHHITDPRKDHKELTMLYKAIDAILRFTEASSTSNSVQIGHGET